jgi:hypothetical protein
MITMYRGKWKFSVMSADEAEKFIRESHFERIRFISITEANGYHIDFQKCKGNITFLPLKFDDCTTDLEGTCITEVQAKNIVKFVLDNHEADKADWFCVNCTAGVSRSAAVCAAIMRILCNDDMPVFTNSHFCPNMTVYREVLNAWIDKLSDDGENTSQEIWNSTNPDLIGE